MLKNKKDLLFRTTSRNLSIELTWKLRCKEISESYHLLRGWKSLEMQSNWLELEWAESCFWLRKTSSKCCFAFLQCFWHLECVCSNVLHGVDWLNVLNTGCLFNQRKAKAFSKTYQLNWQYWNLVCLHYKRTTSTINLKWSQIDMMTLLDDSKRNCEHFLPKPFHWEIECFQNKVNINGRRPLLTSI